MLRQLFTWWNGQTLGTRWFTLRRGQLMGKDEAGNVYYRDRKSGRRWVIYNGLVEASKVPPHWHAWLHHMRPDAPETPRETRRGYRPHQPNMTGTALAWRPDGSLLAEAVRPQATGDYQAWRPENRPPQPEKTQEEKI